MKQQLFILATKKSQLRIKIVVLSVEIITIDVNNTVDYEIFVATKKKKTKQLLIKCKYNIIVIRNKQLQALLRDNKITLIVQRSYAHKALENDLDSFDFFFEFLFEIKIFRLKKQRLFFVLKSINLNNYFNKNFKKY